MPPKQEKKISNLKECTAELSCSLDNLSLSSTGRELSSPPQLPHRLLCLQGFHLLPAEWHKFGVSSTVLMAVFKLVTKGDLPRK